MKIQINTDRSIEGPERLSAHIRSVVNSALGQNADQVTRVEVHLSDANNHKSSHNDKRCMMEARLKGRQPIAVTERAMSVDKAVDGATEKLTRLVESTLGRQRHQKNRRTDPPPSPESIAEKNL